MKRRRYEDGTALVGRSPRDEGGYSGRGGERIFALNDAARGQWAGESSRCESHLDDAARRVATAFGEGENRI